MEKNDIESGVIKMTQDAYNKWDTATADITDKVSFNMRNIIRQCRKNFAGVFDKPVDPMTGKSKIWIPLSESSVESVIKNVDVDSKNIEFIAKKQSAVKTAGVLRGAVKAFLDKIGFGETLNDIIKRMSIDGTTIVKVVEGRDEEGKVVPVITIVDSLNFFIDPTAKSIQDSSLVLERVLMTPDEIKEQKGWINTDDIKGIDNLNENDPNIRDEKVDEFVDVWYCYGLIPKKYITGNDEDCEMIDGHFIVSGIQAKEQRVHLVEENKKVVPGTKTPLKPYEEAWYSKYPGRWHGKGVVEKLLSIQSWLNMIVNIRIVRSTVSQLGLFKIRENSGITAQKVSRLGANGAIKVKNMDDIEQMVVQEASQASYADEDRAQDWARQVTQAFESVTGEQMPASMPATNAAIQSRSAQSGFNLVRENFGLFLERLLKRHVVPIIVKNLTNEEVFKITGEMDDFDEMDEAMAQAEAFKKVFQGDAMSGDIGEVMGAMADVEREKLATLGKTRYFKNFAAVDITEYDVKVNASNEDVDPSILLPNLVNVLQIAPEYRDSTIKKIFDIVGLPLPKQVQPPIEGPSSAIENIKSPNEETTQAVTAGQTL